MNRSDSIVLTRYLHRRASVVAESLSHGMPTIPSRAQFTETALRSNT